MSQDQNRKARLARTDVSEDHPLVTEHDPTTERTSRLVEEIKETADKFARDRATRGDLKIVSRALRELRYAFKVFTPYRRDRKVTVFGSARTSPDHPAYQASLAFGKRFADAGWYVVTGAGGGIMEGAHVGAGRKMSMGLNIMLPFEQESNYVISNDEKLVNLKYFFTRKLMFVKEVHAVALFPGGFGTQDECFETLTLIQTGKRELMPIVLVDEPGGSYWKDWQQFIIKQLEKNGLISPADHSLYKITDSIDEAFDEIMNFYCVYHSMRYVKDKLYFRLHFEPTEELLEELNTNFADIISSGIIERVDAHPQEADEEHLAHMPRLAFNFNRRDMGRLRQMVDCINDSFDACAVTWSPDD
ncbi:LOG family protein [Thalassoglobus polymorphus]|uniref:AMP nucleosidase n=1 Tax=Thalassoglobus polymorphus TaxID=2527994 RepID=A0A517QJJ5_9PLAN|nr:LOG family protein [Thalassoglobus polymorphus]QDT31798.1 putative lysine decarboxylase [Thalassoglobus polymorphus]